MKPTADADPDSHYYVSGSVILPPSIKCPCWVNTPADEPPRQFYPPIMYEKMTTNTINVWISVADPDDFRPDPNPT